MTKSLFALLLTVAVPASAFADEAASTSKEVDDPRAVGGWTFGVKGGLTMGMMPGSWADAIEKDDELKLHQGVALGGFATHYLSPVLAIQPEVYMFEKGQDFFDDEAEVNRGEGLLYIEVPVLARYSFALDDTFHLYGAAGPSFGYLIDSKFNDKEQVNKFDVSGVVGLGTDIRVNEHLIIIELRYAEGFLNTLNLEGEDSDQTGRTRTFGFLLGFTT